ENRRDTHCEGLARNELLAEEIGRRIASRDRVTQQHAGAALCARSGLVDPDVSCLSDAEYLEIDAAGARDRILVATAFIIHIFTRGFALRDVYALAVDVDLREQILPHEPTVGVNALATHRVILV